MLIRPRFPSPSDAAMVKIPSFAKADAASTARVLAEKTGKHEFFAAREGNKTAFANRPESPPVSAIRETLAEHKDARRTPSQRIPAISSFPPTGDAGSSAKVPAPKPVHFCTTLGTQSRGPEPNVPILASGLAASGDRFINSPDPITPFRSTHQTRISTPDLDMTSAYMFHQSKLRQENKTEPDIKRVPIQDLLAHEPNAASVASSPAGCKRAFDDAFSESEETSSDEDVQPTTPGSTPRSDINSGGNLQVESVQSPQEPSDLANSGQTLIVSTNGVSVPVPVPHITSRPAKRRRIAEVAACVAVGGVGVLSALIMSAPSF